MDNPIRILSLDNEFEAGLLESVLDEKGIPYEIINMHDYAYDGIFQAQVGWAFLEAPEEYKEEIISIYQDIKESIEKEEDS